MVNVCNNWPLYPFTVFGDLIWCTVASSGCCSLRRIYTRSVKMVSHVENTPCEKRLMELNMRSLVFQGPNNMWHLHRYKRLLASDRQFSEVGKAAKAAKGRGEVELVSFRKATSW